MPASIEFICVSPLHAPRLLRIGGFVTVVNGAWAYCASALEGRHVWRQIQPTALAALAAPGAIPPTFVSEELVHDSPESSVPIASEVVGHRSRLTKRREAHVIAKRTNGGLPV